MSARGWRKIADDLAERLMHHGYCSRHATTAEGLADNDCPFCADRSAYEQYVEAGGTVRLGSFGNTVRVRLQDVKPNWPEATQEEEA